MGVLGAFFGCSGDGGFNGRCSGVSIGDGGFMLVCISGCGGVVGFNVATSQLLVREKVRPARLVSDLSVTEFAQRAKNGRKSAFYGVQGEFCTGPAQKGMCRASFIPGQPRRGCAGRVLYRVGPQGSERGKLWPCRYQEGRLLVVVVPGATSTEEGRATVVPPQPPTSRAPALREPGKSATASCRRKIPTPRRRPTQNG